MKEIIIDTLIDALRILPFLVIAFLIMEYFEHKLSNKNKNKISNAGKIGPLIGSILGVIPQCGFSVMATNLYATRIISIGTLLAIYLSTSDEMFIVLLSKNVSFSVIFKIIIVKVIVGIIFGFIIDLIVCKRSKKEYEIRDFCLDEHCDCEHGIFKSALKHTVNILLFIIFITFVLNITMSLFGNETLSKLFLKDSIFSPLISSLIGLIPNCAASVLISELYLNNVISFSSCISGLLTSSGVALLVLFKINKNKKENLKIVLVLYLIGSITGIILEFFEILF